jgi:FixJ family two-component response regulator
MSEPSQTVFIVDDDEAVCDSLGLLLQSVGLRFAAYPSAQVFWQAFEPQHSGCLILDVRMPGMSGLELAQRLREQAADLPIIFITGHGDVPMAVEAMRLGAVDFIQKPFRDQDLLDRVFQALAQNAASRRVQAELQAIRERLAALTPRECDVLELLLTGKINKVIASELGLSQRTVELHRARVLEKMQADSLASLVQMVLRVRSP